MKKQPKKPAPTSGATCTSSNSGYKCALTGDHTEHRSEKKGGQFISWESIVGGKLKVTFHQGKNANSVIEDDPNAPAPVVVAAADCDIEVDEARELEQPEPVTTAPTAGRIEEPAAQPGDTRTTERGNNQRWCWGPVGGWGWREYPKSKGKGCPGCGRHKVDCLCKELKAAPPPATVSIGTFPVTPGDDRIAASGRRILGMLRHPAAALFPLLEGDALAAFVERMRPGQRDPIVRVAIDGETYILDGSNRGVACEMLGLTPKFVDYDGPTDMDSLVAYSIDKNGPGRRHLDSSILAMIATEAAQLGRGNPGDRETGRTAGLMTQAEAGKKLGVSERLVRRAAVVKEHGTSKLNDAVMKGRLAVDAAERVARLPKEKQDEIADVALARKSGQLKSGKVLSLARQEEKRDIVRKINEQRVAPLPDGSFGVIYADYPWLYENSDQHEGSHGHLPYPGMTIEQVVQHARDASRRAAKNCVIALWVTNLYIPKIGLVVEAFGATHRTMWTWPKPRIGVGGWSRGQTEHLVIASIGEPTHTMNEISTLLESFQPVVDRAHSSKPEEVALLLQKHCCGPFLELFARGARNGWTTWGAEVDKFATEAA